MTINMDVMVRMTHVVLPWMIEQLYFSCSCNGFLVHCLGILG